MDWAFSPAPKINKTKQNENTFSQSISAHRHKDAETKENLAILSPLLGLVQMSWVSTLLCRVCCGIAISKAGMQLLNTRVILWLFDSRSQHLNPGHLASIRRALAMPHCPVQMTCQHRFRITSCLYNIEPDHSAEGQPCPGSKAS